MALHLTRTSDTRSYHAAGAMNDIPQPIDRSSKTPSAICGLQTRPVAPAPRLDTIPAELTSRPQWVVWRYELDKNGKWTKVPYKLKTKKASHSRPSDWLTFADASAEYQARPNTFDGIGYVFAADDPYVGGDIDHSLDVGRVPPTYAEISPSGNGIKFIGRASGDYGRKTAKGELYSKTRFFTITGNVLPGHETIADCQDAIDAFAASLGSKTRANQTTTEGRAGNGSRAELAASHSDAEYDEGRRILRTAIDFHVRCLHSSAKEGTQLAYLLAGDYAGFHAKWPSVGLFRADDSLDDSQVRAAMARSIYGRGFSFPRYCALMSHFFAAQALAKWGTKQLWREELAALWQYATLHTGYAPRPLAPKMAPKRPLGRANVHAATVEQVYGLIVEQQAGRDAIIHIGDISSAIGVHRRTVTSILIELVAAGRISKRRMAGGAGLLVTFTEQKRDVIIPVLSVAELPVQEPTNDDRPVAIEETRESSTVFLPDREADHISALPTLDELAREYLSRPAPRIANRLIDRETGEIKTYSKPDKPLYRRTAKHFAQLITADYGDHYTADQARTAYAAEKQYIADLTAQEWRRLFAVFKAMTADALITFIRSGVLTDTAELDYAHVIRDKHYFKTRMDCAKRELKWRGLTMPKRVTKAQQQAQDDAAAAAEKARQRLDQQQLIQRLRVPPSTIDPAFRVGIPLHKPNVNSRLSHQQMECEAAELAAMRTTGDNE